MLSLRARRTVSRITVLDWDAAVSKEMVESIEREHLVNGNVEHEITRLTTLLLVKIDNPFATILSNT